MGVLLCVVEPGGNGRLAAQRIIMFPTHSSGPCRQDTSEDLFDTLDRVQVSLVGRKNNNMILVAKYYILPSDKGEPEVDFIMHLNHGRHNKFFKTVLSIRAFAHNVCLQVNPVRVVYDH